MRLNFPMVGLPLRAPCLLRARASSLPADRPQNLPWTVPARLRHVLLSAALLTAPWALADSGAGAAGDPGASTAQRQAAPVEPPISEASPGGLDAGADSDASSEPTSDRSPADYADSVDANGAAAGRATVLADETPATASAGLDSSWEPTPFSASYEARYDGVPFTATGTRTLEIDADGTLHFSSRVHTWLVKLDEEATMELSDAGYLRPLGYAYRVRGIASRSRRLQFDWDAGMVHRTGNNERSAPLEAPAYDPVSWQLALQRDLARGARAPGTVLRYPIADGGDVKVYEIIVRGPQQIELATGMEQTVLLERLHEGEDERSTRVWLAPDRDWLLVKLEAVDDDGRMLQLSLKP